MTDQERLEIIEIVQAAVREVVKEQRKDLWIDSQVHFLDHAFVQRCRSKADTIDQNREFVKGARAGFSMVKTTTAKTAIAAAVMFFIGAVAFYFRHGMKP